MVDYYVNIVYYVDMPKQETTVPKPRNEIEASLLASIQEIGDCSSFAYPMSGYRIELVLNPEAAELYLFEHVGAGTPEPVWHNRHCYVCTIPEDAIPESVVDRLEANLDYLADLVESYLGSEWNGSNWVGRWAEDNGLEAHNHYNRFEMACYWDPGDWFEESTHEILNLAAQGYTPADIMPELYLGDTLDGVVKPDAALEYVTDLIEEHTSA